MELWWHKKIYSRRMMNICSKQFLQWIQFTVIHEKSAKKVNNLGRYRAGLHHLCIVHNIIKIYLLSTFFAYVLWMTVNWIQMQCAQRYFFFLKRLINTTCIDCVTWYFCPCLGMHISHEWHSNYFILHMHPVGNV